MAHPNNRSQRTRHIDPRARQLTAYAWVLILLAGVFLLCLGGMVAGTRTMTWLHWTAVAVVAGLAGLAAVFLRGAKRMEARTAAGNSRARPATSRPAFHRPAPQPHLRADRYADLSGLGPVRVRPELAPRHVTQSDVYASSLRVNPTPGVPSICRPDTPVQEDYAPQTANRKVTQSSEGGVS